MPPLSPITSSPILQSLDGKGAFTNVSRLKGTIAYWDGQQRIEAQDKEAILVFQQEAQRGNTLAQLYLAQSYGSGRAIKQDIGQAKALFMYILNNKQGKDPSLLIKACTQLGQLYINTPGPEDEIQRGMALLATAAEWGDTTAQTIVGESYLFGYHGLVKDEQKAMILLTAAADKGDPFAQAWVGEGYAFGYYGLAKNEALGISLLTSSAHSGVLHAQTLLAILGVNYLFGSPFPLP